MLLPLPEYRRALDAGAHHLLTCQDADGRIADYQLPPGAADGWTTALSAVALAEVAASTVSPPSAAADGLQRAADHLEALRRPGGWGYCRAVATDADSTAFALRALSLAGRAPAQPQALALLEGYLTPYHHARTFADTGRMGAWAARHDDVTPSVGLAMLQLAAPPARLAGLVAASRAAQQTDGTWAAYWWYRPWYATWLNLCWLNRCGGAPPSLRAQGRASLAGLRGALSALDLACVLGILDETDPAEAGADPAADAVARRLLGLQQEGGGFPASAALMLPSQRPGVPLDGPYADHRGTVTTAVALLVLARRLRHLEAT